MTNHIFDDPAGVLSTALECVEACQVAVPTGMPAFRLPDGRAAPADVPAMIIRVTDTDGAQGYSMLWGQHPKQLDLMEASAHYAASVAVGFRIADNADLCLRLDRESKFLGKTGVIAIGAAGVQMALEDLACRRKHSSLSAVIGRRRNRIKLYQTGLPLQLSVRELQTAATGILATGVKAIKMFVGKPSIDEDVARLEAVRDVLPPDGDLMCDALQRWSLAEAQRATERLAHLNLLWIEDPLAVGDAVSYRELVKSSPIPVATGETCFLAAEFDDLLAATVPFLVGELERVGGIASWLEIAGTVSRAGGNMLPHLYPHVSAQLLATLSQSEVWLEYVPWFDSLTREGTPNITEGFVEVSDEPGAGFTPTLTGIERGSHRPWRTLVP